MSPLFSFLLNIIQWEASLKKDSRSEQIRIRRHQEPEMSLLNDIVNMGHIFQILKTPLQEFDILPTL